MDTKAQEIESSSDEVGVQKRPSLTHVVILAKCANTASCLLTSLYESIEIVELRSTAEPPLIKLFKAMCILQCRCTPL
jgi:hypothetical protein